MIKRIILGLLALVWILSCREANPPETQHIDEKITVDTTPPPPAIDTTKYPLQDGYYQIDWKLLSRVNFEQGWHDTLNDYIYYPVFHEEIQLFAGEPIQIKGYIIPLEETQDEQILVLSAFPFSSCFFCGNAGPESVMDIQLAEKARVGRGYKQDDQHTFRGRLRLNDTDVYYLNYILEEAFPVD